MDLVVQIRHLRVPGRRTAGIALGWLIVFAAGSTGLVLMSHEAQHLLATGTKTIGTVLGESAPSKGYWSIEVRYAVDGDTRAARIVLSDDRKLEQGQQVVAIVGGGFACLLSGLLGAGWFRRHRAVVRAARNAGHGLLSGPG
ncbi:hypothetical protein [Amycolatopsis pithecellobii]|uniref:Uncharacterized protein n=1 Tax=Amycolatopsis pithecellobii TaxID=664692 RepID=A0A6N7ZCJ6_9PSEU|nr:hypothetical protein [Amycolatopsis pithecellobii]MTD59511.1 hypothetical protein [Amycolatopsis pithecellobii]